MKTHMIPNSLVYPKDWLSYKAAGRKISMLTAYDATMARLLTNSEIDAFLVGDSLAMVVQGHNSTTLVSLEDMIYHGKMVRRGARNKFIVVDMPFASYHFNLDRSIENAIRLFVETGASALKLEGGEPHLLELIERLTIAGIPIMGHLGLMPQRYLNAGGFVMQGKDKATANQIKKEAQQLEKAGCFALVLELVNSSLAQIITKELSIPTIGIGAGNDTDGQIRVTNDILELDLRFTPAHARIYSSLGQGIIQIANQYHNDVLKNKTNKSKTKNKYPPQE